MATPSPPRTRKKSSLSQDGRTTQRTASTVPELRSEATLQRADTATSAGEPSSPLRLKINAAWTVELRGARATQMQRLDAEFLLPLLDKYPLVRWEITGIAEKRLRESTLLQVVPKEQTRLPSSACLSQSFSYHADLLEDDGDGLRTPPGARGGAGQLI